jgi:hypothetical protein
MTQRASRIGITDTVGDMLKIMGEGNPGALTVLVAIIRRGAAIDPQATFGEINAIITLDRLGIYGGAIWQLYKDVCGNDLVLMLALLRAFQLGFAPASELRGAVTCEPMAAERKAELLAMVKAQLPAFGIFDADAA